MKVWKTIDKLEKFLEKTCNMRMSPIYTKITVGELIHIKDNLKAIEKYEKVITDLEFFLETDTCKLIREFCGHDDWSGKKLNEIRYTMTSEYALCDMPLLIDDTLEEFQLAYSTPEVYYKYPFARKFDIDTDIKNMRNRKKKLENEIIEIMSVYCGK